MTATSSRITIERHADGGRWHVRAMELTGWTEPGVWPGERLERYRETYPADPRFEATREGLGTPYRTGGELRAELGDADAVIYTYPQVNEATGITERTLWAAVSCSDTEAVRVAWQWK